MNSKNFFHRWKEGILSLSPEKQIKGKMIGLIGGIVGLIIAMVIMIYRKQWGFSIFVFFIIWIQFIGFISTRQQLIAMKEMMKGLGPQQQDMESPKIDNEIGNMR